MGNPEDCGVGSRRLEGDLSYLQPGLLILRASGAFAMVSSGGNSACRWGGGCWAGFPRGVKLCILYDEHPLHGMPEGDLPCSDAVIYLRVL